MSYQHGDSVEPPKKRQKQDGSEEDMDDTIQDMALYQDHLHMSGSHSFPADVGDSGLQGMVNGIGRAAVLTNMGNTRPSLFSMKSFQSGVVAKLQSYPGLKLSVPQVVSSENSHSIPQMQFNQTSAFTIPAQSIDGKVTLQISPSTSILSSQHKSPTHMPVGLTLTSSGGQRYLSPQVLTLPNRQTIPTNSLSKSTKIKPLITDMKNSVVQVSPEYIKVTEPVKLVPRQTQISFQVPSNWNTQGSKSLLDNASKVSLVSVNQSDKSSRSLLQSNKTESSSIGRVAVSNGVQNTYITVGSKVGSLAPAQIISQPTEGLQSLTRASSVLQPIPQQHQKPNSILMSNKQYKLVPSANVMTQLVKTETKLNNGKVTMAEAQIMLPTGLTKISWPIQSEPSTTKSNTTPITTPGMKSETLVQGKTVLAKKPLSTSTSESNAKVTSISSMMPTVKVVEGNSPNNIVHTESKNMKFSVIPAQKNWELNKQASELLLQRPNKTACAVSHNVKLENSEVTVKSETISEIVKTQTTEVQMKSGTSQELKPGITLCDNVKSETLKDGVKKELSQDQVKSEVIQETVKSKMSQNKVQLESNELVHRKENGNERKEIANRNLKSADAKHKRIKSVKGSDHNKSNSSNSAYLNSTARSVIQTTEHTNIPKKSLNNDVTDKFIDINKEMVEKFIDINKEMVENLTADKFSTNTRSDNHTSDNSHTSSDTDFKAIDVIYWNNYGIGELPHSSLKFRLNDLRALEVVTDDLACNETLNSSNKLDKMDTNDVSVKDIPSGTDSSVKQDILVEFKKEVGREFSNKDEIMQCENCGEYGFATDFQMCGRFCSERCGSTFDGKHARDVKRQGTVSKTIMGLKRGRKKLLNKDGIQKEKSEALQSGKKSKAFVWTKYLQEENAAEAPAKLFKNPFPAVKNAFHVGMKLEGVDPTHQSKFCILTVAEVCGYRIRLHFDGYLECFDFWTDIDSPFIFPVGFCEKNGKVLQPPKGFTLQEFSWASYLKLTKAVPVPKNLFSNQPVQSVTPNLFRVGSKLEAIDKKNSSLTCVASVTGTLGDKVLIHFDSWADNYDYWCDMASPLIYPVGHCSEMGQALSPPIDWKDNFTWDKYLSKTKTQAVPARAFKLRPPIAFEIGMKVEVVDKRNPLLVRVASITKVANYMVNIHFDGWADVYDYWLEDDSPDIHPPGWCAKTGHPLVPPITPVDLVVTSGPGVCPTPGCKGIGHIKGPKYAGHHSTFGCPYSEINMNKESVIGDRNGPLSGKVEEMSYSVPIEELSCTTDAKKTVTDTCNNIPSSQNGEIPKKLGRGRRPKSYYLALEEQKVAMEEQMDKEETLRQGIHNSVFTPSMISTPTTEVQLGWEQHCKLLPGVADIHGNDVNKWTIDQVATFVNKFLGCKKQAKQFRKEQIDGKAFLMLTQTDIFKVMNIKLGPAMKIFNSIIMFRSSVEM